MHKGADKRLSMGKKTEGVVFPIASANALMPMNYPAFLSALKERIRKERLRVILASNTAMVMLYWEIGQNILKKQNNKGWGARVIDRLSADLTREFPDMKGFSPRNLKYMRSFAAAWPNKAIVQRVIAQLPWRSNIALLDKLEEPKERLWYAVKAIKHGWSQPVLCLHIEGQSHKREGRAINNFTITLPPENSDMARGVFKDPYLFDFLGTADTRREKEIEQALVEHIQRFLLELGQGFAFVGRQVHLELGNTDYYIDLLFYHLKLRCYIVIELKAGDFMPEHVGKMNMYLNVVDDILRHRDDRPSIGLLLVKRKNRLIAEYALSGYAKPMGVAQWETKITKSLPKELKSSLPTIKEIEEELSKDMGKAKNKKLDK